GAQLVSAGGNRFDPRPGEVIVWDLKTMKEAHRLRGFVHDVKTVAFAPRGKAVAAARAESIVKGWEDVRPPDNFALRGHGSGFLKCVAFTPDGRLLASAGGDRLIKIWDTDTGQELHTLKGHRNLIKSIAFAPNQLIKGQPNPRGLVS